MASKKPCSVCRRWFQPTPRAAAHQKTCGPNCSRELHRRRCAQWRKRNPDYDRENRLQKRMAPKQEVPPGADPLRAMNWDAVQIAVGLEIRVAIEAATKLSVAVARDAVAAKTKEEGRKSNRLQPAGARDAVAAKSQEQRAKSARLPPRRPREPVGQRGPEP